MTWKDWNVRAEQHPELKISVEQMDAVASFAELRHRFPLDRLLQSVFKTIE